MIQGIITILKESEAIQDLIGLNSIGDKFKVYPGICPQPEKPPFIVVRRSSKSPVPCKGARATSHVYGIEVIAYHVNYFDLDAIETAVDDALDNQKGTSEGVHFQEIRETNSFDAEYIKEWKLHARVIEFDATVYAGEIT
jgi:hypothetical protein